MLTIFYRRYRISTFGQKLEKMKSFFPYIVLFFGAMIHNEIFIINICGLNLKTQLFLNKDFKAEFSSFDSQNEDIDDEEDKGKNKEELIMMQEIY